jgi:hypothetical protein
LKILKSTSGFSPKTDLSNNITFNRPQSHATVPLRGLIGLYFRFATEELKKLNMKKIVKPTSTLHVGNVPVRIYFT